MVADSVMIAMIFTVIVSGASIIVPLAALYFMARKKETGTLLSFGLGLLGNFWSQNLLSLPFLLLLMQMSWFTRVFETKNLDSTDFSRGSYIIYILITALLLAFLAALARIWCIWLMNRKVPSLYRAMSSAVGFASINALGVIALYLSCFINSKILNAQGREGLMKVLTESGTIDMDEASSMIDNLMQMGAFDAAMQGINVVMALLVDIALFIIIYEGYIRKKTVKAVVISGAAGFAYSFFGMLINALGTGEMGNVIGSHTGALLYDSYVFACALVSAWIIFNAVKRYKRVLAEGPYAHYAYFEKSNKGKDEKDKIEQVL